MAAYRLASFTYAYDLAGNRTKNVGGRAWLHTQGYEDEFISQKVDPYTYDGLHRAVTARYEVAMGSYEYEDFEYDDLGNRVTYHDERNSVTTAYANNVVNEYTELGTPGSEVTVHYDAAGNLSRDEVDYEYGYDYDDRLTKVTEMVGREHTEVGSFEYDALGRLISSFTQFTSDARHDTETFKYYYDGSNAMAEYDPWDNLSRRYIHGTTYTDERAVLIEGGATANDAYYYLLQELYTVTGLMKKNGTLCEANTYDVYGKVAQWGYRDFDFDRDGDVDSDDVTKFNDASSGDENATDDPMADWDFDGDADSWDSAELEQTSSGEPPIALLTSAVGNPYHFTGRRLFMLEDMDQGMGQGYPPNFQLQYNRARHYRPLHGRWLQRDPAEYVDGMNLYQYVRSNPVLLGDPFGLWNSDVHRDETTTWAQSLGYPSAAANAIGAADIEVDGGWSGGGSGPGPHGDQSCHFDRPFGGEDSRLAHHADHRSEAKAACTWPLGANSGTDDPEEAARQLGFALHPLQDWVAHGDHFKNNAGSIWDLAKHNGRSPQVNQLNSYGATWRYPDDPRLDALGGSDGRPAGSAIVTITVPYGVDYDYAQYHPGSKRINLTEQKTKEALRNFREYLKEFAKDCGKCRDYFGVK